MIQQHAYHDPRVGRFALPRDIERPIAEALLSACVVLHDEQVPGGHEFIAHAPLFEPLMEGEEIPRYRIEFVANCPFEDAGLEAKRVDVGPFGFAAVRQYVLRIPTIAIATTMKVN